MPRKQNTSNERYNDPFPSNLRILMDMHGVTQKELSEYLGLQSRQSITGYCDGSVLPNIDTLTKIASFFNVSSDYLLGLNKCTSHNLQFINDEIGLSESAIQKLRTYAEAETLRQAAKNGDAVATEKLANLKASSLLPGIFHYTQALSDLIEHPDFSYFLRFACIAMAYFKTNIAQIETDLENIDTTGQDLINAELLINATGQVILPIRDAARFYAQEAVKHLTQILESFNCDL